jgi:hypothetical protein
MSFQSRIKNYKAAAYPLLVIETHEEDRVLREIKEAWPKAVIEWDCVTGLVFSHRDTTRGLLGPRADLSDIFSMIVAAHSDLRDAGSNGDPVEVFVFKDATHSLKSPLNRRAVRNACAYMRRNQIMAIFIAPRFEMPSEWAKEAQVVDYSLPNREELVSLLRVFNETTLKDGGQQVKLNSEIETGVAEAAMGMTSSEADSAFALAAIAYQQEHLSLDLGTAEYQRLVFQEKISQMKHSALEYRPTKFGFEAVGGLDAVKLWAMRRRDGFSKEARALHLPYPKGVMLAGVKGTGKTLIAQAIAHQFGFPLFSLDIGKLFASKVGETEALTRDTIKLLESIGRAVILID